MHFPTLLASASLLSARQNPSPSPSTVLTVDLTQRFQEIDGFGFSEAFQRAYNIYNLEEPKRTRLIDLLFNTTIGAGFSIVRNGIGSSVNSSKDWMNSIAPVGPQPGREVEYVWFVSHLLFFTIYQPSRPEIGGGPWGVKLGQKSIYGWERDSVMNNVAKAGEEKGDIAG